MGLGKIRELANTIILDPLKFQIQIPSIPAGVDSGLGGIG